MQYDVCHAAYERVNNSVFRRLFMVSSDVDDVAGIIRGQQVAKTMS